MATDSDVFPYSIGGVERFVASLANHMSDLGAKVEVACGQLAAASPLETAQERFKLVRLEAPSVRPSIWRRYRLSRVIARHIREREGSFDVVYGHRDALWTYVGRRRLPCVVNFHGMENFKERNPLRKLRGLPSRVAERQLIMPRCDRIISLGGHLTTLLVEGLGVPASRIAEIPNGVELDLIDRFRSTGSHGEYGRTWLFVGRLSYNKGLQVLLEAFRRVSPPGVSLVIIGEGPLRPKLEALSQGLNVTFAGRLPDAQLFSLYHQAEAFVFPTENEGMPTVILEAMACGLPIVASDIGAVCTMVTPQNGRMVRPGDVEDLANAMKWLERLSPAKRQRMGQESRKIVESYFTWKIVAERTLELCERVIKGWAVRSA